jgi:hypothetical protein
MPMFLLAYRYGKDVVPGDPNAIAEWRVFFANMGDHVVDAGNPTFARAELGACETNFSVLGGYSFITADDLDQAVELAKGCPSISRGGGVEVGEITIVSPNSSVALAQAALQSS